jgi:amino acid transporter
LLLFVVVVVVVVLPFLSFTLFLLFLIYYFIFTFFVLNNIYHDGDERIDKYKIKKLNFFFFFFVFVVVVVFVNTKRETIYEGREKIKNCRRKRERE